MGAWSGWITYITNEKCITITTPFSDTFYPRCKELGGKYRKKPSRFEVPLHLKDNVDNLLKELFSFIPGEPLVDKIMANPRPLQLLGNELIIGPLTVARMFGREEHLGIHPWAYLIDPTTLQTLPDRGITRLIPENTHFLIAAVPREMNLADDFWTLISIIDDATTSPYIGQGSQQRDL